MPLSSTSASTLPLSRLVEPLPLGEMLPLAGDRAVAGAVAVADDQEGVVVEGMGDDVLVHVVAQVAVEAGADVLVDRLQLDEDQRQAVDEADEIGAAVVVRRAQAGELQLYAGSDVTSMQQENSKLAFRKIFSVPIMTPLQSAASSPAMIQRPGGLMVCRLRLAGG